MTAADSDSANPSVGGKTLEKPAFCLLDGFIDNPNAPAKVPFRLPINRLPAELGRGTTGANPDTFFFTMGNNVKAMSRLQCRIEYRTWKGSIGPLTTEGSPGVMTEKTKFTPSELLMVEGPHHPKDDVTGYFAITCLGKNSIKVNGERLEQDDSCVLTHGSTIKISTLCLYFLLPKAPDDVKPQAFELPPPPGSNSNNNNTAKRKLAPPTLERSSSSAEPKLAKKQRGNTWTTIQEQLDSLSTDELLVQLKEAVASDVWDRKHQFMGATVAYRAVKAAAAVPEIKNKAQSDGVSKAEIVEWIQTSPMFQEWAETMQSKLEPKSYQSSISKAMARAGYERINNKNFGRHVRWSVPSPDGGNEGKTTTTTTTESTTPKSAASDGSATTAAGTAEGEAREKDNDEDEEEEEQQQEKPPPPPQRPQQQQKQEEQNSDGENESSEKEETEDADDQNDDDDDDDGGSEDHATKDEPMKDEEVSPAQEEEEGGEEEEEEEKPIGSNEDDDMEEGEEDGEDSKDEGDDA